MKKIFLIISFLFYSNFVSAQILTQISTIDALLAGYYDGVMPLNQLITFGNFGIGTFNELDGEMIIHNGVVYQFKADGILYEAELTNTTPFAAVVHFEPIETLSTKSIKSYKDFEDLINNSIHNKNLMYAIKVAGNFSYIKTRSVPAQQKPYKPLTEVTKTQPIFEKNELSGTLIGFLLPSYTAGINVPGFHLHFISDDLSFGGHVLEFSIKNAEIQIQEITKFSMILPKDSDFGKVDLSQDRTEELRKVEK